MRQIAPDWVKGVAIVLMVFGHTTPVGRDAALQRSLIEFIYTFHMPVFLIISGFFFKLNKNRISDLKNIFRRIGIPYLFFISMYLIALWLVSHYGVKTANEPPVSAVDFLRVIFLDPRGAYWFLHSLVIIQLILCTLMIVAKKQDDGSVFVILFGVVIMALISATGVIALAERTFIYFFVGVIIARFSVELPRICWSYLIVGLLLVFFFGNKEIYEFSSLQVVWSILILSFLVRVAQKFPNALIVHLFAYLGRNSLVILVLHAMFLVVLKAAGGLVLRVDESGLLLAILEVIFTLAGCMVAGLIMQRMRVFRVIFGSDRIYWPLDLRAK